MTPRLVLVCVLAGLLLCSSVSLVYVQHVRRELFTDLRALERERDRMHVEWGQLQLEQSTLTTHGRVEQTASKRMHMRIPEPDSVVILRQ